MGFWSRLFGRSQPTPGRTMGASQNRPSTATGRPLSKNAPQPSPAFPQVVWRHGRSGKWRGGLVYPRIVNQELQADHHGGENGVPVQIPYSWTTHAPCSSEQCRVGDGHRVFREMPRTYVSSVSA